MKQGSMILPLPPPQHVFCLIFACGGKKINQRISIIRELRNAEAKENSQLRLHNKNVVIKHSQGPIVLSPEL